MAACAGHRARGRVSIVAFPAPAQCATRMTPARSDALDQKAGPGRRDRRVPADRAARSRRAPCGTRSSSPPSRCVAAARDGRRRDRRARRRRAPLARARAALPRPRGARGGGAVGGACSPSGGRSASSSPRAAAVLVYLHVAGLRRGARLRLLVARQRALRSPHRAEGRRPDRHRRHRRRHGGRRARLDRVAAAAAARPSCWCSSRCGLLAAAGPRAPGRAGAPQAHAAGSGRPARRRRPPAQPPPAQRRARRAARRRHRGARWTSCSRPRPASASSPGAPLLGAFAAFHAGMGVLSLLLQATLSRAALRQLGIAGTLALRPPLTAAERAPRAPRAPRFATATLARGAHESLTNSLFRSAYELLYTPVPEAREAPREGGGGRVRGQGGRPPRKRRGGPRAGARAGARPSRCSSRVACLLSLAALACRRGSTAATSRRSSRACSPAASGSTPSRPSTRPPRSPSPTPATSSATRCCARSRCCAASRGLARATAAASPARPGPLHARRAARSCARASPPLVRAVLRAQPGARPAARRRPCCRCSPRTTSCRTSSGPCAARRRASPASSSTRSLDPAVDPVVRRRIPRVLKACPTPRAAEGLQAALDDPSFDVRAAAAAALAALHERSAVVRTSARRGARRGSGASSTPGRPSSARSRSSSRCSRWCSSAARCRSPGRR